MTETQDRGPTPMGQEPKRLAVANGILCTANEDGSIPLNSKCVELSLEQIADLYNERADLLAALEAIGGLTIEGSNGEPATATVLSHRLAGAIGHARAVLARAKAAPSEKGA